MAAVRLQSIKPEYGDKISVSWKSYPLVPGENPDMHFSPHSAEGRRRADLEEPSIGFRPWDSHQPYPTSSMPALRAAKCAQLQGEAAFQHFHIALFKAFFQDSRNISDREELISLAGETGLDVEKFSSDFDHGSQKNEILAEWAEANRNYEGCGVPLAIIGDSYPMVGAVPPAMYHRVIDLCLGGQA